MYLEIKVSEIQGRHITHEHLSGFLNNLSFPFNVAKIGSSVNGEPIHSISFGTGPKKILMWSQMHGNESTTTKAVLDFINLLKLRKDDFGHLLQMCSFKIIPILNPDGAKAYTRVNANSIDLNRDAQDLSQPESKILRNVYDQFRPHYCFNLHDQRTIFNVGETEKPATVSFLAPAFDAQRNISLSRKESMLLIVAMNQTLQKLIPGQVGRYDDAFNPNCVGDAFQMLKTPTILFEAGHFENDYDREKTREYIFHALFTAVDAITKNTIVNYALEDYQSIPENAKQFFDVLIQNASLYSPSLSSERIGVLYQEVLKEGEINFEPKIEKKVADYETYYGHVVKDCSKKDDLEWLSDKGILKLLQ
ncbi:M14 metallopeptidase family protein [Maribacter sp. 2304DJ31-5]|uniref:M14 family metallopeptidase n=1 Tax=Maribacter sp. 2304DJ31-5 TaxID=3386273 RepID=UPI0039BD3F34